MSEPGVNDPAMPEHTPEHHPTLVSPGAQLAAHRRERGWSIEQVASHLNLAPRQVVAIEADDYPSLPGMAIVRGFVRQYAKLLRIDAAPLLASLGGETVMAHESIRPRQSLSTPFSEARLPSMTERQGNSSRLVFGALLVVLVGVAAWALLKDKNLAEMSEAATSQVKSSIAQMTAQVGNEQPSPTQSAPANPPSVSSETTTVSEPMPGAPTSATVQADAAPVAPSAASSTVSTPITTQADSKPATQAQPATTGTSGGAGQTAAAAQPTTPATAPASGTPATPGKDTLVIKARQDSWVEVKPSGASKPLLARLIKAGESETLEVTEPVSVVIGNAAGVEASLRGSAIELKAPGNGNVARLTLK